MPKKSVSAAEMRRAIANTPSDGASFDENPNHWGLHPEILAAARAGNEDALATTLGREGLGGRVAAKLLLLSVQAEKHYRPVAEELPALTEATQRAARQLEAMTSLRPQTPEDATARADAIEAARTEWSKNLNLRGKAELAANYVAWSYSMFPALFGCEPQLLRGEPVVRGSVPPEVGAWYRQHDADPWVFNSWQQVGRQVEPRPRRIVRAVGARVNTPPDH